MTKPASEKLAPPTDLELMLYFDGELEDAAKIDAIERHLEASADARGKLNGLAIVGRAAKRGADERAADFDVADLVMAKLDEAPPKPAAKLASESVKKPAATKVEGKPANDNARWIFGLATVAAAAAAALMFWGQGSSNLPSPAPRPIAMATTAPAATDVAPPAPIAPADDDEEIAPPARAVEVAAVDFGDNSGTIMYAPGEEGATTVIWIQPSGE